MLDVGGAVAAVVCVGVAVGRASEGEWMWPAAGLAERDGSCRGERRGVVGQAGLGAVVACDCPHLWPVGVAVQAVSLG